MIRFDFEMLLSGQFHTFDLTYLAQEMNSNHSIDSIVRSHNFHKSSHPSLTANHQIKDSNCPSKTSQDLLMPCVLSPWDGILPGPSNDVDRGADKRNCGNTARMTITAQRSDQTAAFSLGNDRDLWVPVWTQI
jgi:hypothetical protein